jgi:phage-related protein
MPALPSSVPVSPDSDVAYEVRMFVTEFSDGYSQRVPDGVNNLRRVYTIVHDVLTATQASTLRTFYEANSDGTQITADTLPTDSTNRNWWIRDWQEERAGPIHFRFSATLVEDR